MSEEPLIGWAARVEELEAALRQIADLDGKWALTPGILLRRAIRIARDVLERP